MSDIIKRKKLSDVLPKKKKDINTNLKEELEYMSAKRSIPKIFLWTLVGIFIVFLILAASTLFTRVRLDITPKTAIRTIDHTFEAQRELTSNNSLTFGTVRGSIEYEEEIQARGEETVSEKSSGIITVYNNYDRQPQVLIANTRFESSAGKIYRIQEQTTVPGMQVKDEGEVPGSIDVKVYADEAGEEYNLTADTFTIPGFAGGPRYDKFSAKTKTAIEGGFVGTRAVVSDKDRQVARENIKSKLNEQSLSAKDLAIAPNFLLFPKEVFTSYEYSEQEGDPGKIILKGEKVVQGIVFNKEELYSFLADQFIPNYEFEPLEIINLSELDFSLEEKENFNPNKSTVFKFNITGDPHFVWQVEIDKLKEDLKGLSKNEYQDIIGEYSSISKAQVSFLPPWIGTIPENSKKIRINIIGLDF